MKRLGIFDVEQIESGDDGLNVAVYITFDKDYLKGLESKDEPIDSEDELSSLSGEYVGLMHTDDFNSLTLGDIRTALDKGQVYDLSEMMGNGNAYIIDVYALICDD